MLGIEVNGGVIIWGVCDGNKDGCDVWEGRGSVGERDWSGWVDM